MRCLGLLLLIAISATSAVTRRTVCSQGCDHGGSTAGLQAAVDSCRNLNSSDPCIITLRGEIILSAPVILGATTHTKWIVIRSAQIGDLPENQRITEADASKLAKINLVSTGSGVLIVPPDTTGNTANPVPSHYLLQGLDITYTGNAAVYGGGVSIGLAQDGSTKARQIWQSPRSIIVDRCWIHGLPFSSWTGVHALIQGVRADGSDITVKNSLIEDLHMDPAAHGHGETHAVFASNGIGPMYVYNNHLEAAIGSITGGEWTWLPGLVHVGSFYFGNEYTQKPERWHWIDYSAPGLTAGQPCENGAFYQEMFAPQNKYKCVDGAWQSTTETRARRDWNKNAWECKNCRLAVVEGNYIHDIIDDYSSQFQHGHSFLLNHVDAPTGSVWARFEYVKIFNNRARRVGQGVVMSTYGGKIHYRDPSHIYVDNNLFEGVSYATVAPAGADLGRTQLVLDTPSSEVSVTRMTSITSITTGTAVRLGSAIRNIEMRDNIFGWGSSGYYANGAASLYGQGCSQILPGLQGARYFSNWGFVNTASQGDNWWNFYYSSCPDPKSKLATWADVKFVNYNDGDNGDYRLCTGAGTPSPACTSASSWAHASSTGGPLGADIQVINWATAGVQEGTPDFHWWQFQIRRADQGEIRYTAYDSGACGGTVKDAGGGTAHAWTDNGGGLDRSSTPPTLNPGIYTARVTCTGGRWREESVKVF